MSKAIIRPDGWVVCGKHQRKKLFRIDKEGIKLPCSLCHDIVLLDTQTLYDFWKEENITIDELREEIKGE